MPPDADDARDGAPFRSGVPPSGGMSRVVERNIHGLLERRAADQAQRTPSQRVADRVTSFTGSMAFVFIHLALFGTWIVWNLGLLGLPEFDESFVVLAMAASVEAIFLSTFVLISQNRSNERADERADLDLQINLLTEHEVTRLITLVTAVAERLGIEDAHTPEIDELAKDVHPERVMETMERVARQHAGG